MKTTKKILAILLAFSLLMGCAATSVLAQQEDTTQLIAAIPADFKSITTVNDSRYETVFSAAEKAVLAIAEYSDDEIMEIANYEIAFDAYCYLYALACKTQIPSGAVNADNWQDAFSAILETEWYAKAMTVLGGLAPYTSVDPEDSESTFGLLQVEEVLDAWLTLAGETVNYVLALPEKEQMKVDAFSFTAMLDRLPETITIDNILPTMSKWFLLETTFEAEYNTPEAQAHLNPQDIERYRKYAAAVNSIKQNQKNALVQQLEKEIANTCDVASVSNISFAKGTLLAVADDYQQLNAMVIGLTLLYDDSVLNEVENIDVFAAYSSYLVPEFATYGDLNGDFSVDATDALIVLKIAVNKQEATDTQFINGDVNGDHELNASDALLILKYAVDKIDIFPVEEMDY